MTKEEIQKQMKFHLEKYTELKSQLDSINSSTKRDRIEKSQRDFVNEFRQRYTLMAPFGADNQPIDWEEIESKIFTNLNLDSLTAYNEGYSLGYDANGMAGLLSTWKGGGAFTVFAEDERDATLYREREARRRKIASSNR